MLRGRIVLIAYPSVADPARWCRVRVAGGVVNAQMLGDAAPMAGPAMPMLPSTAPAMYQQALSAIQQQWAVEDAQIHEARKQQLYQTVLAACAPQDEAAGSQPVPYLLGGDDPAAVGGE